MIDYGYIVKILGSLMLVILMMVVLLYLMKRFSFKSNMIHGSVRIISALNIGPRERIMLIQAGDEQILVGSTPSSIRALHVLADNVDTSESNKDSGGEDQPSMKAILSSLMKNPGASLAEIKESVRTSEPKSGNNGESA